MKVMSQEQYKEYHEKLKSDGFPVVETTTYVCSKESFDTLERIFGKMPWTALKRFP